MTRIRFVGVLALSLFSALPVLAQNRLSGINDSTVTLLAGEAAWGPKSQHVADALQHRDGLRIIPMQGDGCITATADVLQLTQVDSAVLETACVDYAVTQGLLPQALEKLVYISRIDSQPLLLVTRRSFPSLTSLAGKRIATGPAQSAAFAAGELLLADMGLPFVRVAESGAKALSSLVANEADAVLVRGTDELATLDTKQFHILGLLPPAGEVTHFAPALVAVTDLPGLVAGDTETVSTALVLAVYDWPQKSIKAEKIGRLAATYIRAAAATLQASELSARVPGWKRHPMAERALKQLAQQNASAISISQTGGTP